MSENDDTAKESQIEQSMVKGLAERLGLSYMTNTVNSPEITPEMIEAGLMAYVTHDEMFESREEIVSAIYRAMRVIEGPSAPLVEAVDQKKPTDCEYP